MTSMGTIEFEVARFILILAFGRLQTYLFNNPTTSINDAFFCILTVSPETTSHHAPHYVP